MATEIADTANKADALEQCEQRMQRSFLDIAESLAEIKSKRLFEAADFKSFSRYCEERWKLSRASASRMLSAYPILQALPKSFPIGNSLREYHLRPLFGMRPASAAKTLQRALEAAPLDRDGQPRLTRKLIEETARQDGWQPRREWMKKQRATRRSRPHVAANSLTADQGKSPVLEQIERLCRGLTEIPLTAHEAVQEFGEPSGWEGFEEALQWMRDAAEG